jgi:SAM-dependent methyltransferase
MGTDDAVRIVADGYDRLGDTYASWATAVDADPRDEWLERLEERLAPGAHVLDLGTGNGIPTAARLATRYEVEGIDLSAGQIDRARVAVPSGSFRVADMTSVEFEPASFDAVVALYSIIHVPRVRHPALFARIARWLKPGGWFLAALGGSDGPDWTGQWLGVPMFFSSPPPGETIRLLEAAELRVAEAATVAVAEPEGHVPFLWVLARRDRDER